MIALDFISENLELIRSVAKYTAFFISGCLVVLCWWALGED